MKNKKIAQKTLHMMENMENMENMAKAIDGLTNHYENSFFIINKYFCMLSMLYLANIKLELLGVEFR
jgi:hypothetical protein